MCLSFPRFPEFPIELQREVFLLLKYDRRVHRYAHVAKRMHKWLEPYVYRSVRLSGEDVARTFLASVAGSSRALNVVTLIFAAGVNIPSMVKILTLCENVENLAIQASLRYLACPSINPLLEPMSHLVRIKTMYTDLATVPGEEVVNLLNFVWFNRVSRLHLNISWTSLCSEPRGIPELSNLTHLSMFWTMARSCFGELRKFLKSDSTVVLIIWINEWAMETIVQWNLRHEGLQDPRVVILRSCMMRVYMSIGGFWKCAETIVKWRVVNQVKDWEVPHELVRPPFFREYRSAPGFYIL